MSTNISQKQIVAGKLKFESELAAAKAASEASNRQTTRVFDVPVVVNEEKCISGCHVCVESCPVDCVRPAGSIIETSDSRVE
jgi:NAD-dependent dihydropyrimidine dehydrogenase PreA subunit